MNALGIFVVLASTALGMHSIGYSFDSVAFWCSLTVVLVFSVTQGAIE